MTRVINARADRDGTDEHTSVAAMEAAYRHLQRCDPDRDIVVAEEDGRIVGYGRTTWEEVSEGWRVYWVVAAADPDHDELLALLYDRVEEKAREVAGGHPSGAKRLQGWAREASVPDRLMRNRGYRVIRYEATLVRPHLDEVPTRQPPAEVEIRPVEDGHLRAIWEAEAEAFRDHWGYVEQTEADWNEWLDQPHRDPTLWRVAWAGDQVVGQVRSYIDDEENQRFGRKRGWTEDISTAREWRGRGIASALICASLLALKERGMKEAALGVDTENPTGAFGLYQSLGYRPVRSYVTLAREIDG